MSNTSKIRIVTDSSSDIPSDLAAKYAIEIIPMYVGYDGNLLKDLFEIKPEQVYAALEAGKKVIKNRYLISIFFLLLIFC